MYLYIIVLLQTAVYQQGLYHQYSNKQYHQELMILHTLILIVLLEDYKMQMFLVTNYFL